MEVWENEKGCVSTSRRFGAVVLIEKLVFNVAYEKIAVAECHFGTHGHAIALLVIIVRE